jgi:hypothetical protein
MMNKMETTTKKEFCSGLQCFKVYSRFSRLVGIQGRICHVKYVDLLFEEFDSKNRECLAAGYC